MHLAARLSSSVCDLLRNAGAKRAAEQGQVHIISVAPIKEAVGKRWSRHQDLVEDFVLRSFKRTGREDDLIVRVNDSDFILIQPGRSPMAALSRASQLTRETLSYFLGAVKVEHVRISVVERLADDGVETTSVSANQIEKAAAARSRDLSAADDGSPPWERFGVTSLARKVVMIERPNASSLRAMFYLQPVWNLPGSAVASFLILSLVLQESAGGDLLPLELEDLTPRCHIELAMRRLAFAEEVWAGSTAAAPALHIPVAFGGLTQSSPRTRLISQLTSLRDKGAKRLLLLELTDVPEALSHLTISALITQLKPFVKGILVRTNRSQDIGRWQSSGACGVVWCPDGPSDASPQQLNRFVSSARDANLAAGFYQISNHSQFVQAWAAGFSHLSGELISRIYGEAFIPRRFEPQDLYANSRL